MNKVRYKYLNTVCGLVDSGKDIVVVSGDFAAPRFDNFRTEHADRYVSVGIAEQNIIQVACGLALAGETVITHGVAPFTCIRAVDQIRNAASLMHLPISIVSTGVGFATPTYGATHYCTDDVSIMRTIPNVRIINLSDETMAEMVAGQALTTKNILYIRIDRYSDGILYERKDINFSKGFSVLREGKDIALIASGWYVNRMLTLADKLKEYNIDAKVIDLYSLPFDEKELITELKTVSYIYSVEEHILTGGIGAAVLEAANRNHFHGNIRCIGIDFGSAYPTTFGSREYFMKFYGLDDDTIIKTIKESLNQTV